MVTSALAQFRTEAVVWRSKIDFMMELTWLTGLVTVPLVFNGPNLFFLFTQPKQEVIHLTGLILVCLWTLSIGLSLAQHANFGELKDSVRAWFRLSWRNAYYWGILAFVLFTVGQIITWLLSPLPAVSFLSRDANDPGNNVYTILASLALFITIALKLRRRVQVERLMWVVAGVGTVTTFYGILQFLGVDPIGLGARGGQFVATRVYATFGNPIFFSAYLVFSVTCTLALGTILFIRNRPNASSWIWLAAGVVSAAFQFMAMWLTDSRGPLVGVMTSFFVFTFLLLLINSDKEHRVKVLLLLAMTVIAWLTNWVAGSNPLTNPISLIGVLASSSIAVAIVVHEAGAYAGERSLKFWQWRFKQGLPPWWFWALSAAGITLLMGYLFVYNNNSFIEEYVYVFPTTLLFAMLLGWRTVSKSGKQKNLPDGSRGKKRARLRSGRSESLVSRFLDTGHQFASPLAVRITLLAVTLALILLVPLFSLFIAGGEDLLGNNGNRDRDIGSFSRRVGDTEEVTLADELSFVSTRRTDTWFAALELLATRQSPFEENTTLTAARHVFGYGQEMYALAYPQTAVTQVEFRITANPHNLFLLIWLEHGLWGILSFLALLVIAVTLLMRSFLKSSRRSAIDYWPPLVSAALLALLAGRLMEQTTGVARVSDIFLFWGIFGMVLALPWVMNKSNDAEQSAAPAPAVAAGRKSKASRVRLRRTTAVGSINLQAITKYGWRTALPVTGFFSIAVLALVLFISVDLTALYYSGRAVNGYRTIQAAGFDYTAELRPEYLKIRDAALSQPTSDNYASDLTNRTDPFVLSYLDQSPPLLDDAQLLAQDTVDALTANQEASRFSINTLVALRAASSRLHDIAVAREDTEAVAEARQDFLGILDEIVTVLPTYPRIIGGVAENYVQLSEYERGAAAATQAIDEFTEVGLFEAQTHYTRSFANYRLENYEEAKADLHLVLENDPTNTDNDLARRAAEILALIARAEGDQETENEFTLLANRLSTGVSASDPPYYHLVRGQIQAAIDNHDLAISEFELSANHETPTQHSVSSAQELQSVLTELGQNARAECYATLAADLLQFLQPTPEEQSGATRPTAGGACAG